MTRQDPLCGFRFRVEIDGIASAAFSSVRIGQITTEVVEYRDGTDPGHLRKLSGLTRFGNVVLERGITTSLELVEWHRQIVTGQLRSNRKSISIVVADESGADVLRFVVTEAWPAKIGAIQLNAESNEVLIESLELVNEGIERVK